jgi:hypothetical protein
MVNQIKRISKQNSTWKALASLILGALSGILIMAPFTILLPFGRLMELGPLVAFVEFKIVPLFAFLGLIFGILGLKSTKKKFAIVGIILCLIGLIVPLYYFLR